MSVRINVFTIRVLFDFAFFKVTYDSEGGCYELLTFSSMEGGANGAGADPNELRRGPCLAAVFLARNRFAVLDKNRQAMNRMDEYIVAGGGIGVMTSSYDVCD